MKKLPDFSEEKRLRRKGFKVVAGVDEVGRGAFAGPIVAAAVAFPQTGPAFSARRVLPRVSLPASAPRLRRSARVSGTLSRVSPASFVTIGINDSKQLKPKQREKLAEFIKQNALSWGIGEVGLQIINRLGIGKSTKMAFRRAIAMTNEKLKIKNGKLDFLLIDAFYIPYVKGLRRKYQKAIIHGDQKSISIAAASILAKVYRDGIMRKLARKHPQYGWGRNKGYGTREHQGAIKRYGITRLHRKEFVETWANANGMLI